MFLSTTAFPAWADKSRAAKYNKPYNSQTSAVAIIADVVLLRPLGLAATVVGSFFFVAALPFSLLGGNVEDSAKKLVVEPALYTFKRPAGAN